VTSIVGTVVGLVFTGSSLDLQTTLGLFTSGVFVASALAGVALARSSRTAAVLLAVLIVAPAMAFSLPLALRNAVGPEPFEMTLARWAGVLVPLLGALTLIAFAEYVRRKLREPSPTALYELWP
ncbi:MAG: hypothetical protein Q7S41_00220, partial [Candidatus Limnocylindria bacterium]|nr:hypothetical protein [Candidatus Limnocylindria bacterium]